MESAEEKRKETSPKESEKPQSPESGLEDVPPSQAPAYSVFSLRQKRMILFLAAFAAMFSPLSSFIYYPALKTLSSDLHKSLTQINLTITSYMVISGIVPTMWGDLADQLGRRPIYMAMLSIYISANIGLALQRSYPALLVLRMLQSFGGSATVGVSYGIVGDIVAPAERGQWMSIAACGPNVSPAFGPVFGGILVEKAGWPWIFWFLALLSATSLALIVLFYPETSRNIVANGCISVHRIGKPVINLFDDRRATDDRHPPSRKLRIPNPLLSISIFLHKETAPVMLIYGIYYTNYCCLQASLSTLFIQIYKFTDLTAGLVYIPFGAGCFIAALFGGRRLNHDYRVVISSRKSDADNDDDESPATATVSKVEGRTIQARLRSFPATIAVTVAAIVPFGWTVHYRVHPAVPLTLQFVLGAALTFTFTICNTLLVDLHPSRPATAQASVNLIRCGMAGVGLAVLQPLIDAVGVGWTYTILAGLTACSFPLCWVEVRYGMSWTARRNP